MSLSVNGINGANSTYGVSADDKKEAEVAKKLGMSLEDFQKLSEAEKKEKVNEYNAIHPEDPIEDKSKGYVVPQTQQQGQSSINDDNFNQQLEEMKKRGFSLER